MGWLVALTSPMGELTMMGVAEGPRWRSGMGRRVDGRPGIPGWTYGRQVSLISSITLAGAPGVTCPLGFMGGVRGEMALG